VLVTSLQGGGQGLLQRFPHFGTLLSHPPGETLTKQKTWEKVIEESFHQ
jgi:hypothetical protein